MDKNAQKGLKAVAVIMSGPDSKPWIEKLAADKGIRFPIAFLPSGKTDAALATYKLNPKASNTFLVGANKRVETNLVNVTGETFDKVADATVKMLDGK